MMILVKSIKKLFCVLLVLVCGLLCSCSNNDNISISTETSTEQIAPTVSSIQVQNSSNNSTERATDIDKITTPDNNTDIPDGKYSYTMLCNDIDRIKNQYKDISVNTLAITQDERKIFEIIIGNQTATKQIVIQYGMHANEYLNCLLAVKQVEYIFENMDNVVYKDKKIRDYLKMACIHILPMVNPDGITVSQYGVQLINNSTLKENIKSCFYKETLCDFDRANEFQISEFFNSWKANACGVDLNRNFDVGWEDYYGSPTYASKYFKGDKPNSQIETKAILELVERINPIAVISYHSQGSIIYSDYGCTGEIKQAENSLAELASSVTGYEIRSTISDGTDQAGCSDYMVLVRNIPAITIETGVGNCPVNINQFEKIFEQNKNLPIALLADFQR